MSQPKVEVHYSDPNIFPRFTVSKLHLFGIGFISNYMSHPMSIQVDLPHLSYWSLAGSYAVET